MDLKEASDNEPKIKLLSGSAHACLKHLKLQESKVPFLIRKLIISFIVRAQDLKNAYIECENFVINELKGQG